MDRRSTPTNSIDVGGYTPGIARIERLIIQSIQDHDVKYGSLDDKRWQTYSLLNHHAKTGDVSAGIGEFLGCSARDFQLHRLGGNSHDIGKLDEICEMYRLARALTAEELIQVRKHPRFTAERLEGFKAVVRAEDHPFLDELIVVAGWHHEPFQIDSPRLRRISARIEVADIFVTIQEDREKPGMGLSEALHEMESVEEYLLKKDPRHVECIDDIREAVNVILTKYSFDPKKVAEQLG